MIQEISFFHDSVAPTDALAIFISHHKLICDKTPFSGQFKIKQNSQTIFVFENNLFFTKWELLMIIFKSN